MNASDDSKPDAVRGAADAREDAQPRAPWTPPTVREYALDAVKSGAYYLYEYGITATS